MTVLDCSLYWTAHCSMFEVNDHTILEGATNEYMKQLFTLAASNILDSPSGKKLLYTVKVLTL